MRGKVHEPTSHVVQKPIFVPEHHSRSDDSGIGECFLDGDFALSLAPVELRGRLQRRVQMGDVNELRNTALLCDMSDRFGTGDVHGAEIEVPVDLRLVLVTQGKTPQALGFVIPSDKVVHDIRVSQALCGLLFVPHVPFLPNPRE